MIDWILLLQMFLTSWVITSWSVEITTELKPPTTKIKPLKLILALLLYLGSCPKCLSFWITLGFTRDFFIAAAVAFLIMLVEKINRKTIL